MKRSIKMLALTMVFMAAVLFAKGETVFAASAPIGLQQVDDYTTSFKVQWNAVVEADVFGYNIYYSTNPSGGFVRSGSGDCDTQSTYRTISNLSAGCSYWVSVATVTRTKVNNKWQYTEGPKSAPIEVVTAPNCSNAKLVQTNATTKSITMQYIGANGANYYVATIDNVAVGTSTTPTITTNLAALRPASKYYIYAYACRRSSTGYVAQGSNKYEFMKTVANKIGTDSFGVTSIYDSINVYYFGAVLGDGGQTDGYEFQFMKPNGKSKKTFASTIERIRIENYINGTFRKYRVRTYVNCNGVKVYSAWSDYNYIGVSKKVNIQTKSSWGKKAKVTWKKISGASRYVIYVSKKEKSGYKKVATVSSKKSNYTITKYKKKPLSRNTRYYVKIVPQVKVGKKYKNSEVISIGSFRVY